MKKAEKLLNLIESLKLKEFDKTDWDTFAGAEKPSKDQEPLTGEMTVTADVAVVVDKNGVTLNFISRYGTIMYKKMPFEQGRKFVVSKLKPKMNFEELESLGFEIS